MSNLKIENDGVKMAGVETVFTVAIIFWLGYERFIEKLVDPLFERNEVLKNNKPMIIYLIALLIGVLFFFTDLRFLKLLFTELGFSYTIVAELFDLIVTALIFASGPDIIHQIMSLIQSTKENQKAKLTS